MVVVSVMLLPVLDGMSSFNTAPHTLNRALLEPVRRFFDMRQCAGIGFAARADT